jgi:polygalacturonase
VLFRGSLKAGFSQQRTPSTSRTIYGATGASVSGVTYTGNTVTSAAKYGVVIQQDYENGSPTGTPTNGVTISDINFTGTNTVSAASGGQEVYVLCGKSLRSEG